MSGIFDKEKFDEEFENNRKLYKENPEEAHRRQEENVKKLDEYTGGKSMYDEGSGVWYLSDGRQSDKISNGTLGNSFLDDTFNRKNTSSYKDYEKNREKYSEKEFYYDVEKDPLYKSYKKQYTDNGEKVMEDTLAKASSKTGGIASSYAVSAAASAMNDYMKGLGDVSMELEDKAYKKYEDELARYLKNMSIAESEMAKEEKGWEKKKAEMKEEAAKKKAEEEAYTMALRKFESEGREGLKEEDWKAIYRMNGWYNPSDGKIYDSAGNSYEAFGKGDDYSFVLSKFQDSGWESLSDDEKRIALKEGWYDINTGYLYDSSGNAYAPRYSNVERALVKYKAKGLEKLSEDELLTLTHAGYKVRYGMLLDDRGYAV